MSDAKEFIGLIRQGWTLGREITFGGLEFGLTSWDPGLEEYHIIADSRGSSVTAV